MPAKAKEVKPKEDKTISQIKKEIAEIWDTLEETLVHLNWMSERMTKVLDRMGMEK